MRNLCVQEEPIFVLYKLPTVIISRRNDQYSKAFENLMGQVPQQGIPRSRANAVSKGSSGADGPQVCLTTPTITLTPHIVAVQSVLHLLQLVSFVNYEVSAPLTYPFCQHK